MFPSDVFMLQVSASLMALAVSSRSYDYKNNKKEMLTCSQHSV